MTSRPWDFVFDRIVQTAGFDYRIEGDFILVATNEELEAEDASRDVMPPPAVPPISLDFKQANIRDIVLLFNDIRGVSFVLDPGVAPPRVTVKFSEVPWNQALFRICRAYGLLYTPRGESVVVSTPIAFKHRPSPAR